MNHSEVWVSTKEYEKTTDIVLEYIDYLKGQFKRIHKEDVLTDLEIMIGNEEEEDVVNFSTNERNFESDKNVKMWYRRGDFSYRFPISGQNIDPKLDKYLNEEWELVKYFLHDYTSILGSYYEESRDNKLKDLRTARDCGIEIPDTLVTTSKEKLLAFFKKHKTVLSKPIHNGHISFQEGDKIYASKGILILDEEMIEQSDPKFCLSLFQNYVEKEFEIRIFFMNKDLYPMAIFSQLDEQTKLDFRNYNQEKPNRNVPLNLPDELENKLRCFIDKSGLTTGSIDLIYSTEGNYVFLEVNPGGQFGWVSGNCNYYIEKRIAEYLINA